MKIKDIYNLYKTPALGIVYTDILQGLELSGDVYAFMHAKGYEHFTVRMHLKNLIAADLVRAKAFPNSHLYSKMKATKDDAAHGKHFYTK